MPTSHFKATVQPGYLYALPNNSDPKTAKNITNKKDFVGVCPSTAKQRAISVVAILANVLLSNPGVTIKPAGTDQQHVGGSCAV